MAISKLSDWEQVKIHEVVSDERKIEIIIELYPDKRLTLDELKEQTNLSKDSLKTQLKCLKETSLVEMVSSSVTVYFLTPLGKDLVSSYSQ